MTHPLTKRFAYIVALVQLGAGLTGIILGASHFAGVSYRPAKHLLSFLPGSPAIWWSALLAGLAAVAVIILATGHIQHVRTVFALLAGYWTFWTVLFACAWPAAGSGAWAPWIAAMCVVGNSRPVVAHTLTG